MFADGEFVKRKGVYGVATGILQQSEQLWEKRFDKMDKMFSNKDLRNLIVPLFFGTTAHGIGWSCRCVYCRICGEAAVPQLLSASAFFSIVIVNNGSG